MGGQGHSLSLCLSHLLLLADGALSAALVVVGGEHGARLGQREELLTHIVEEQLGVAGLEVCPAAASDEQCVSGRGGTGQRTQHTGQRTAHSLVYQQHRGGSGKQSVGWTGSRVDREQGGCGCDLPCEDHGRVVEHEAEAPLRSN